jgi:DNA-binding IclR family transcriptional regulator
MNEPVGAYQAANTLAVLELVAERPRSVPELADVLQLYVRTVRRITRVLDVGDYVERIEADAYRKRYRIGRRGRALGRRLAVRQPPTRPTVRRSSAVPPRSGRTPQPGKSG